MRAPRGFRYELEALMRQRTIELDEAGARLREVESRLQSTRERLDAIEVRFAGARAEWVGRQQELSAQWHRVASIYLRDLGSLIREARAEMVLLERERDAAAGIALEARRALEIVEKHREGEIVKQVRELDRKLLALADEAFVQRRSAQGDPA